MKSKKSEKRLKPSIVSDIFQAAAARFGESTEVKPSEIVEFVNGELFKLGFPKSFNIKQFHDIMKSCDLTDAEGRLDESVMNVFHPDYKAN